MKPKVYIETTVVSYLTAWPSRDVIRLSHEMLTREWWAKRRDSFDLFASDFVIEEASRGDPVAAAERLKALADIPLLPVNSPTTDLARRLAASLALPPRARLDAAHVAISAVCGMDFLLTWNCTHLANGVLADKIDRTCAEAGFEAPNLDAGIADGVAMIDYDKPDDDPIVAEVRRAREEFAAGFNYDLRMICEEMQRRQATTGRKYASITPRRVEPTPTEPAKKAG